MVRLHPPFRRATDADRDGIAALVPHGAPTGGVVAEEEGSVVAIMSGEPAGDAWRIEAIAVRPDKVAELGPRILAVADALAADEGLAVVSLRTGALAPDFRAILDGEGFRPAGDGDDAMERPVVPQG